MRRIFAAMRTRLIAVEQRVVMKRVAACQIALRTVMHQIAIFSMARTIQWDVWRIRIPISISGRAEMIRTEPNRIVQIAVGIAHRIETIAEVRRLHETVSIHLVAVVHRMLVVDALPALDAPFASVVHHSVAI